ncbi:PDZ domain-containing protein [Shimazuella sp. AN120528]|uniref:PDZ domain-containing protein n=1 Tax=Shimazuella soli TaxID=1892854 RepID=UPI001F116DF7|nr:PDZ domain-containing protein [Shimazuella soli]MCH5585312.1 PDZ domain-containing protein [Shimazuella soli]
MHLGFMKTWIFLWTEPLWIIALLLPILFTIYTNLLERKHFGHIVEAPLPTIFRTCCYGLLTGLALSLALSSFMFDINKDELFLVWIMTISFAVFRRRFACIAYSVGFISLLHLALPYMHITVLPIGLVKWYYVVEHFSVMNWLYIVGFAHFLEWILIRAEGSNSSTPVRLDHISGKSVPGYLLAKTWPISLVAFTPAGWLPLPIMMGFASKTCSKPLKQKKRLISTLTLLYAGVLSIIVWLGTFQKEWIWAAAVFALFGHEVMYLWSRFMERRKVPLFVSDEKGLKVLAVLPQTPAAVLGIKTGDIIHRLNGVRIQTAEDLEQAVSLSSFCKLEVLDEQQDSHFLQRAIYEKDPKHLGIVGADPL